ncbi:MAG: roadblock/LC7 domain-containing protein [Bdellovibrionales bacterium]|nr:roadblock/LC7 domain-containing protein [Bdellovibrionales bacterium]
MQTPLTPMTELLPDGTKPISLSREQFSAIEQSLKNFYRKTKCGVVMLSDESGLAVAQSGRLDAAKMALLSTLAAGNYAATAQMANLVSEATGFDKQYHEGRENSIYITGVLQTFFLVIVFGKESTFAMIRVLAEKLIEELRTALELGGADASGTPASEIRMHLEQQDFQEELSSRLDSILGSKGNV